MTLTYTLEDLPKVAKEILDKATSKVICFDAPMGAGKTTLIKEMVHLLGVKEIANSPTFGIVNEYYDTDETAIAYHFDCYRLNDPVEALDFGLEDYLNDANIWVFIEWPDVIKSLLPHDTQTIEIKILTPEKRSLLLL